MALLAFPYLALCESSSAVHTKAASPRQAGRKVPAPFDQALGPLCRLGMVAFHAGFSDETSHTETVALNLLLSWLSARRAGLQVELPQMSDKGIYRPLLEKRRRGGFWSPRCGSGKGGGWSPGAVYVGWYLHWDCTL